MLRLAGLLILLLSLPLTATAAERPSAPRAPGPDEALVVFYRVVQSYGDPQPFFVNVNRTRPVQLGTAEHTWLYMKPGAYVMGPRFPEAVSDRAQHSPATFTIEAGKTHYFRISTDLEVGQEYPASLRSVLVLQEVSADGARAELYSDGQSEWRSQYRRPQRDYARLGARAQ